MCRQNERRSEMNRVYKYGCLAPTFNAFLVQQQIRAAHRYRNQLVEIERARRTAMAEPGAEPDKINALAADLRRGARALTTAYWGTYLLIESADDQARKAFKPPHFMRWEGDGAVGVQIQGGMTPDELASDRRVQLTTPNARGHAVLRLRTGSEGRDPVWAEWPIVVHREIPKDAIIKGVTVHMRRRGRKSIWSAEFSLQLPEPQKECGEGAVGIDLGWRMINDEERVCTFTSEDGRNVGELRLTAHELSGFDRVETLRSTRDKLRNELQARLMIFRNGDASQLFRDLTTHLHVWRSSDRYHWLLRQLESQTTSDHHALELLRTWKYKEIHLLDWESEQNTNNLEHRKAKYSEFAAALSRKYEVLVLERFDLRAFSRRPAKDVARDEFNRQESHQAEKARKQRHEACTSMLRSILRNAFERRGGRVVEVSAVDTTRTCNVCGLVADRDFAASIDWTCDCGAVHDQDVNASDNLCERWRAEEKAASARNDKDAKRKEKRESKWARLKREKVEKVTARAAENNGAE